MELSQIEDEIACGEMSAAQVFTQMKQHINSALARVEDLDTKLDEAVDFLDATGRAYLLATWAEKSS